MAVHEIFIVLHIRYSLSHFVWSVERAIRAEACIADTPKQAKHPDPYRLQESNVNNTIAITAVCVCARKNHRIKRHNKVAERAVQTRGISRTAGEKQKKTRDTPRAGQALASLKTRQPGDAEKRPREPRRATDRNPLYANYSVQTDILIWLFTHSITLANIGGCLILHYMRVLSQADLVCSA